MDLQVLHDELHAKINEIDEKLDSQVNQKAAGKRSIVNGLIDSSKETWQPVGNQLVEQLATAPIDLQIGIYYGLLRMLNDKFSKTLSEAVDEKVESIPDTPVEKLDEEVVKELSALRSELYGKVKQLVEMNETFGGDANMHMPKRRTGGRGKRGPRALSLFTWEIEGTSFDKLKEVAEVYDQYEKAADITKALREAGIDTKNPPERIEFTLPDGKILVGTKGADDDSEDEEDSEDSEDSED